MKKNSFMTALMLICVVAVTIFIFCGGIKGQSAYQLALQNGFKGTETEWLASLKGKDGEDGETIDYQAMFTSCKESGEIASDTTYLEFIQMLIEKDGPKSQLLAIQNSLKSSVSIFVFANGGSFAGAGSFFKINADGSAYIVTNYHVTYTGLSTSEIRILLYEDSYLATYGSSYIKANSFLANYVGGIKKYDLSVLEIPANDKLKDYYENNLVDSIEFASTEEDLAVGTPCYAVGNPLGEGMSTSQGIVSVAYEEIEVEDVENSYATIQMRAIRTSCNINGGNSGGGLFNDQGKLIGVINSKREKSSSGTVVEGVSFAIPLDVVINVYNRIIEDCNGLTVTSPQLYLLGIATTIADCKAIYNEATGIITTQEIVEITEIVTGSLATGKLYAGDILDFVSVDYLDASKTDISNKKINHYYTLSELMLTVKPGDKITIHYTRGSGSGSVTLTIAG